MNSVLLKWSLFKDVCFASVFRQDLFRTILQLHTLKLTEDNMIQKKKNKTIGILTSGGDAPGMNAAIRSVARCALSYNMNVLGIMRGYKGLLNGEISTITARDVSDILQRGGTTFQTARSKEFATAEGVKKASEMARIYGIDALVVIGGDGSFRGAKDLSDAGVPVIGIPATIDNDIGCTDYTIGFDTATNTAMEAIDKIRDTATSHERCNIIEVMGREAGYIALNVAIASGAEAVLIPEQEYDIDAIVRNIIEAKNRGKKHYIIIVAEGVGGSAEKARYIEEMTGVSARETILGYMQRGGSPTLKDRLMASKMGYHAVELVNKGVYNRLVIFKDGKICDVDIQEGLAIKKTIERSKLDMANRLSL